jgi:hypothetical protein
MADQIVDLFTPFSSGFSLNYNKNYIGLAKDEISQISLALFPRKKMKILQLKHKQTEEKDGILDNLTLTFFRMIDRGNYIAFA